MAERHPATALRGGKASEDSLTIWTASLVVAYVVDFQSDLFSSISFASTVYFVYFGGFEGFESLPFPVLKTDRIRSEIVWRPVLRERSDVRLISEDESNCILLDPRSWEVEGPDVGRVVGPILRSGVDPTG